MKKTIIEEIWEIRGLVDEGILFGKPEKIIDAKQRMDKLSKDATIFNTETTLSMGNKYRYRSHQEQDGLKNAMNIIQNMQCIYNRFVKGEDCSAKFGLKPQSILEHVWLMRAMIDDLKVKLLKVGTFERSHLELMEVIQQAVEKCVEVYGRSISNFDEYKALISIREEIIDTRKELFGNARLINSFEDYSQKY